MENGIVIEKLKTESKDTRPIVESSHVLEGLTLPELDDPGKVFDPPPPPSRAFTHTTHTISHPDPNYPFNNVDFPWYWTRIEHSELNGNPSALLTVTPKGRIEIDTDAATATMVHNPNPVGVVYRSTFERWYIYNLNFAAMPHKASFNVVIEERYRDK